MSHRVIVFAALLAAFVGTCFGQGGVTLSDTEQRSITASKIGRKFGLLVSLPDDYASSGKRYPVLYVLDGWHFPLMAFLQNNNKYSGRMPPAIIVTISQGTTDYMTLRAQDFTPTKNAREAGSGEAPAFLDFLEHEVIPFVDRTYRTVPTDRALLGHSYGGLFAVYALEQRPGLFQRIVAASPILSWDDGVLVKAAADRLKAIPGSVRLHLSVGGEEDNGPGLDDFMKVLGKLKPSNLEYTFVQYAGENHNSVRLNSFPAGLAWVYGKGK